MVKVIETEVTRLERIEEGLAKLSINGVDLTMNADQLRDLIATTQYFYDVNNLYQHTEEAIKERERWENEDLRGPRAGLVSGAIGRY